MGSASFIKLGIFYRHYFPIFITDKTSHCLCLCLFIPNHSVPYAPKKNFLFDIKFWGNFLVVVVSPQCKANSFNCTLELNQMYFHLFLKLCPKESKNVKKFSRSWVNRTMYTLTSTIFWPKTYNLVTSSWRNLFDSYFLLYQPLYIKQNDKIGLSNSEKDNSFQGNQFMQTQFFRASTLNIQVHSYMLASWIPHWLCSTTMNIKEITVRFMHWGKNKSNSIIHLFRHTYPKPVLVLKKFSWSVEGIKITL